MAYLTFDRIRELKVLLLPYGLTLHLHDTCGGQAFGLEAEHRPVEEDAFATLESFFAACGMTVRYFNPDKMDFSVK